MSTPSTPSTAAPPADHQTPRRPSTHFTWGVRAALLVPLGVVTFTAADVISRPLATHQLVHFVVAALVLLAIVALVWWSAARPRLDLADQYQLSSQLGRAGRRRLHRALRRGQPLPAALQPYAHPYVSTTETGSLFGFVGASLGLSSMLFSITRLREATGFDAVVLALTAAAGIGTLVFVVVTCRMRKHLRQHHESKQPSRPTPSIRPRHGIGL